MPEDLDTAHVADLLREAASAYRHSRWLELAASAARELPEGAPLTEDRRSAAGTAVGEKYLDDLRALDEFVGGAS